MRKHNVQAPICEELGPRLKSGRRVGRYIREEGSITWERAIKDNHVLRFLDALTVNEHLLHQIQAAGVDWIRYRLHGQREYLTTVDGIVRHSIVLPGFAEGETVYALPRSKWRSSSAAREPDLFNIQRSN